MKKLLPLLLLALMGCFRPIIPISTGPKYPVDVFYDNQRPDRLYDEIKSLFIEKEAPLLANQKISHGRMMAKGNSMEDKDVLLAKLTLEAKKLGADALVHVRYKYFANATTNGYSMEGMAVRYKQESR